MTTYYSIERSTIKNTPSKQLSGDYSQENCSTNTLNYDFKKLLGDNGHNVNVLVGHEFVKQESNKMTNVVDGLPTFFDAEMAWNFMGSGSAASITKYYNPTTMFLLSFFGRAITTFKLDVTLYLLQCVPMVQANFGEGNKWGYFHLLPQHGVCPTSLGLKVPDGLNNLKLAIALVLQVTNNIPTGQISKNFHHRQVLILLKELKFGLRQSYVESRFEVGDNLFAQCWFRLLIPQRVP